MDCQPLSGDSASKTHLSPTVAPPHLTRRKHAHQSAPRVSASRHLALVLHTLLWSGPPCLHILDEDTFKLARHTTLTLQKQLVHRQGALCRVVFPGTLSCAPRSVLRGLLRAYMTPTNHTELYLRSPHLRPTTRRIAKEIPPSPPLLYFLSTSCPSPP